MHRRISIIADQSFIDRKSLSVIGSPGIAKDIREIYENPSKASDLTYKGKSIAIVSNGSSVLGLGNLGALSVLPVLEMKSMIYAKFANINAFPLAIDSSNIEEMVSTIKNISLNFSAIHLEDIKAPECFILENMLSTALDIPVIHIDQHGTSIAILAGLINASKVVNKPLKKLKVVINGAGAAGLALTSLLIESGIDNIILFDSKGQISKTRHDLTTEKKKILSCMKNAGQGFTIESALLNADVFIGLSVGNIMALDQKKISFCRNYVTL